MKDTHIHRSYKNNTSQRLVLFHVLWRIRIFKNHLFFPDFRKTFKRSKYSHRAMNREISKMRQDFQSMNLKNQIMLKNTFKKLDSLKLKDLPGDDDDDCKNTIRPLLNEFTTVATQLVLCNDNDFKINDKPNIIKQRNKVINCKKKVKQPLEKVYEPEEDINENIMRIECKHINYQEYSINIENEVKSEVETLSNGNVNTMEIKNKERPSLQNNFDNQLNDLQTLLVMMAISPKPNNGDSFFSTKINCQETGNDIIKSPRNSKVTLNALLEEDIQIGDFLNVTSITVETNDREKQILKKYVMKWKLYIDKKKNNQRQDALNFFFDKLTKKKLSLLTQSPEPIDRAKLIASDFNRYQHRYISTQNNTYILLFICCHLIIRT